MLPEKFVERMRGMLGEEAEEFLESLDRERFQALRIFPGKTDRESFLKQVPFSLEPVPWEENGFYYRKEDLPGKHPYHAAGVYYIQEPSAMVPALLLDARPGERVLDLCAAPGGKSTQLAAAMQGKGLLVCNEIHPVRAKSLSENIERLGIGNCLVTNETPGRLAEEFPGYFQRILVDAPCSGEGMFRKNEEAAEEWSPENVRACAARQDEILDCAAEMLCPGGRLVYSTCTFSGEEDEGTVARFLLRHPEFRIKDPETKLFSGGRNEWALDTDGRVLAPDAPTLGESGRSGQYAAALPADMGLTVRLWPHKIKGEGHFAAVLEKGEKIEGGSLPDSRGGQQRGISRKECRAYFDFEKENLKVSPEELLPDAFYLKFGDQLYLCPPKMPSIKGLKVLRPGLHLGTLKKDRFEPSHALALFLKPDMAKRCLNLSSVSRETEEYLKGLTFPAQGGKGWYLIAVDGYSLGWGKLAGGIMKNHYPKGLRRV